MSNFRKNFRDNVVAPYNKYNLSQEKLAEVLDVNKKKKTCTVTYRNIDGIKIVADNVPVKGYLSSKAGSFPKKGDYVEIQEVGKTVRILSVIDKNLLTGEDQSTGDTYSNSTDIGGYLGI